MNGSRAPHAAARPVVLCLLLFFSACFASPVAAQAPEGVDAATYGLDWWTFEGGGASYVTGGAYTLGSTAGQPDAAIPATGGAYTLRAGFWLPSCTASAAGVTLNAALDGETVVLSWTLNRANQAYQVHRGEEPYFTPSESTQVAWIVAGPWPDGESPIAVGNSELNYYYLLRPNCGASYADAAPRAGEFDFELVAGSQ